MERRGTTRAQSPPGFDFTGHMRRLCADIVARLEAFRHVDLEQVALRVCQTRRDDRHGVYASLTPLRFAGGATETVRRRRRWRVQPICDEHGREMLYLLSFYLPRFLDLPLDEKLATVCHELWHISPQFDGDLRRHAGRCYAHGPSEEAYHDGMRRLAECYLASSPPPELHEFLRLSFQQLHQRHGGVWGLRIRTPRLVPVALPSECQ